jgi:hypothetical protein
VHGLKKNKTLDGGTKHLTPALSPFCSADSAKRGEGETLPASMKANADGFYGQQNCLRYVVGQPFQEDADHQRSFERNKTSLARFV